VEDRGSPEEIEISSQDFRLRDWESNGWKCARSQKSGVLRQYYFHDQLPGHRFLHPVALTANQKPKVSLLRDLGALCFMALSANIEFLEDFEKTTQKSKSLSLILSQNFGPETSNWADVYDMNGYCIGSVKLATSSRIFPNNLQLIVLSRWNTEIDLERFYSDPMGYPAFFEEPATTDVLDDPPRTPSPSEIKYGGSLFDERKYKNGFYCYYNVMAVEWIDGAAYRIGLGKVHVDGFRSAGTEWKRIELR